MSNEPHLTALRKLFAFDESLTLKCVDVGAANRKNLLPADVRSRIELCAIDPDRESWSRGRGFHREVWSDHAVSDRARTTSLNIARKREVSSLRRPNMKLLQRFPDAQRFKTVERVPVQVFPLDTLLPELDFAKPDFVKIDVQGQTWESLKGGANVLQHTSLLQIELENLPLYMGQKLMPAILGLLDKMGFVMLDMRPIYWFTRDRVNRKQTHGQLVFTNALFTRKRDWLSQQADIEFVAKRMAALLLVYGYGDFASDTLSWAAKDTRSSALEELSKSVAQAGRQSEMYFGNGSVQEWTII